MQDKVYIGLGSNLGDREQNIFDAVAALSRIDAVAVLRQSSLYESAPVGPDQPRFMNAVVEIRCGLEPRKLLSIVKQMEHDLGRRPGGRWGPRIIDMDILLWEGRVVAEPRLQIPHVELHSRRFALEPLCELDPDAWHPVLQVSVRDMLAKLTWQDVVRFHSREAD